MKVFTDCMLKLPARAEAPDATAKAYQQLQKAMAVLTDRMLKPQKP